MSTEDYDNDYIQVVTQVDEAGQEHIVVNVDSDHSFKLESADTLAYALRLMTVAHLARWCSAICRVGKAMGVNEDAVDDMAQRLVSYDIVDFAEPLSFQANVTVDGLNPGVIGVLDGREVIRWSPAPAIDFANMLLDRAVAHLTHAALRSEVEGAHPRGLANFVDLLPYFVDDIEVFDTNSKIENMKENALAMLEQIRKRATDAT